MSEPIKICIIIEGGMVQGIITAGVPVEAVVIDYDADGADPEDLVSIPQADGGEAEATVALHEAEASGAFVLQVFEIAEGMEEEG